MIRTILFFLLWLFSAPVCAYPGWHSWASRNAGQLESMIVSDEEVIRAIKEVPAHYTSPTLVQHVSTSNTGQTGNAYTDDIPILTKSLSNPAQSGNCLICTITCSTTLTINLPTDDAGNTWSSLTTVSDSGNTCQGAIFGAFGVAAGTRSVSVTFGSFASPAAGASFATMKLSEFCFVSTNAATVSDGQKSVAAGSTTTPSTGSFTTTTNGDLIYCAWFFDSGTVTSLTSFTPGTNFSLLDADAIDGFTRSATEYWVQPTAGAINPGFTLNASVGGIIMAVALKADAAKGSAGPAFSIIRELHFSIYSKGGSGNVALQLPCSGNTFVLQCSVTTESTTNAGINTTPVIDSNSNTWAIADQSTSLSTSSHITSAICYAGNATSSNNMTGTFRTTNIIGQSTLVFYDIAGGATSPLGSHTAGNSSQGTAGYLTTGSITPSQANGLIFTTVSIGVGDVLGIHGQYTLFDSATAHYIDGVGGTGNTLNSPLDEDNGYAHEYNPDTASRTYTWSGTFVINDATWTAGPGFYSYTIAEFKSASPTSSGYTYLYGGTTLTGLSGANTWQTWKAPASSHGNTTMAVWGASGGGSRKTSTTGAAGGGGGKGGDCSTALTPTITDYNSYVFWLGGGGTSAASPYSGNYSIAADDSLNYTTAASGKSAAANSATGATTSTGTSVAGPGGATHAGGNGATGTASGGGGGGGAGGPTGAGGAGSVTTGGTAGTGTPAAGSGGAGGASGGNHPGTIGNAPGGAGGGGFFSSVATVGGNGVPGQVIITVTIPATPPPVHMDYNVPFWNWYEF